MTAAKPITLTRSSMADGIDLANAHFDGLDISHSTIGPIVADLSEVAHDVTLTFDTIGPVSLFRSKIGGTLDCTGSRILVAGQAALNAAEGMVGGDVLFHDGFQTDGRIDFRLAKIGYDLSLRRCLRWERGEWPQRRACADCGDVLLGRCPTRREDRARSRGGKRPRYVGRSGELAFCRQPYVEWLRV
jgi:hypothetical protein